MTGGTTGDTAGDPPPRAPRIDRDDVRLSELSAGRTERRPVGRAQVAISLALAATIVLGAWLVGGRVGLGEIGSGGVARQYLPKAGEQAPPLGMFGPDGKAVFLSSFRGQAVWINFWGSWCPPCQAEFPAIETAYETLRPQGVTLLAISARESWDTADAFARANGGTFPVYNIPDLTIFGEAWDTRNFPTHLFIDADGIVRYVGTRPFSSDELVARGQWLLAGDWTAVAARAVEPARVAIRPEDTRA